MSHPTPSSASCGGISSKISKSVLPDGKHDFEIVDDHLLDNSRIVHLVEDDGACRRAQAALLREAGCDVRTWPDGKSFLKAAPGLGACCVMLDVGLPELDGLAVHEEMIRMGLRWPVVFVSGDADIERVVQAMRRGAVHFLTKPIRFVDLEEALISAFAVLDEQEGGCPCAARIRLSKLTNREREVLEGLVEGLPNKSIAYDLGVSHRTVEAHRANIMCKLQVSNLAQLVRLVIEAEMEAAPPKGSDFLIK